MQAMLLKDIECELGEGPLWDGTHLWFFDILGQKMYRMSADGATLESWEGDRLASAAARTTGTGMLVATETDLMVFDPETQDAYSLCPLEADRPDTRSNDARADRQGGFWVGTMSRTAEAGAGAIYRYFKGELRCLRRGITVPNTICFSPDGRLAYFGDSALKTIYRWMLDDQGWPLGAPTEFCTIPAPGAPDGAVVDEAGDLWVALWGAGRVQRITRDGTFRDHVIVPVPQPSCPALTPEGRLYITSAWEGMSLRDRAKAPNSGGIFVADVPIGGLGEPRVILP